MAARKGTVDLNARAQAQRAQQEAVGVPPHLPPNVTDAHAVGYAAGVQARRGGLSKYQVPVSGGEGPPIPALEQPYQEGMTMAQQAQHTRRPDATRHAQEAVQSQAGYGSIIAPDVQQAAPAAPDQVASLQDLMLLPADLLPPEATKDPNFQAGAGSRMAMSQPHMAAKYGIIRNGRLIPPHDLVRGVQHGPPRGQHSDLRKPQRSVQQIAEDLRTVMGAPSGEEAVRARQRVEKAFGSIGPEPPAHLPRTDEEAVAQAKQHPSAVAAEAGKPPVPSALRPGAVQDEGLDDIDYEALQREMIRDILKNPKQREEVEKRVKPLDISELILHNAVRQRVPIIPGKFEPTFESMRGDVELALKRLIVQEGTAVAVTESYLLDKYAVMSTAAGLVQINEIPVPNMFNEKGDFDEDLFWKKFNWVLKRPIHMLASLGIHYAWFEQRVRKLFKVDEGKDG